MKRCLYLVFSLALTGCLSDPELKDCAEFEFGAPGCGTPCEVYCDYMIDECSEVYASRDRCINDCANEPVSDFVDGNLGDEAGNSLACRLTYALQDNCQEASLRSSTQCIEAGCADYCELMLTNCEGAYPSLDNCLSTCGSLPRGAEGVDANTVECRFGYAEQAANDPSLCNPASMGGGGVCGAICEVYCDFVELNCTGADAIFADRGTCASTCALLDGEGAFDDWSFDIEADSVQCRLYHAGPPAALEPAVHCPHAGIYNSAHCGIDPMDVAPPADWPCVTFCDLVMTHCPGTYASAMECQTDCAAFPEVMSADPTLGPSIYPVSSLACPM